MTPGCKQSNFSYVNSVVVWTQIFTTHCSLVSSIPSYIFIFKSQLPTFVPPIFLVVWEGLLIRSCCFLLLVEPRHISQPHPAALWSWISDLLRTKASVCPTNLLNTGSYHFSTERILLPMSWVHHSSYAWPAAECLIRKFPAVRSGSGSVGLQESRAVPDKIEIQDW